MLTAVRNFAKSWPAKILMALLAISFVGWGVNQSGVSAVAGDQVIKAGSRTVTSLDFRREYDNYKKRLEQQQGQPITVEQAQAGNLDTVVLNGLATREALAETLSRMGVKPSDKLVLDQIQKIPAFFDPITGRFDKKTFEQRLGENGLTPEAFDAVLRDEMAGQHWAVAIQNGLSVPRAYGALASVFALESRDLSYVLLGPSTVPQPAAPTDAQLTAFINENKAQLTLPEMRVLTVVPFTPGAAAASAAAIDPAELQKRYQFRKDTLSKPETRTIVQIPAKDQAAAQAAVARLSRGEAPAAVARSLGVDALTFDDRPLSAISDRKVGQAAFRMAAGQVGAVQGDLGVAVVKVVAITPGREVTLEEARPMLEAEIRKDMVAEKVYAQTQAYDDAHQGGSSLADAAQKAGVTATTIGPITAQGQDGQGRQLQGFPPKILETAFTLPAGGESEVTELGEGAYFAVRVERIVAAHVPPLAEIRPMVAQVWMQREIVRALEARAAALTARVQKGESLDAVAGSSGLSVLRVPALTRQTAQAHPELGREVLARAFSAKPDEAWSARAPNGIAVGRVDNVRTDSGPTAARLAEENRGALTQALFREMGDSAQAYARTKLKVKVDPARARNAVGFEPLKAEKAKGKAEKKGVRTEPPFEAFRSTYDGGAPQVVWTRLIDDLETPVSAFLKIGHGKPYAFLFESVEGGAFRARYSIITLNPDLVWRCRGDQAEVAEGADIAAGRFTAQPGGALDSLRDLLAASRIQLPEGLPPMAAGVFGALGYDTIRLVERLPDVNPDPLDLPDGVLARPSIVAIFDAIAQEILLVTAVRPDRSSAGDAYAAAQTRLQAVAQDLRKPAPPLLGTAEPEPDRFTTPVDRDTYRGIVEKAKGYIRAGDIFQVVPSHRFRAPFPHDPFALYRSLRRTNPSPFLFFLDFGGFHLAGSSPEILVRLRDGKITIRPLAGTRPRGATPEEDRRFEEELIADPKERAEHLMLLDLGRNDVGRVAMLKQAGANEPAQPTRAPRVRVTDSFFVERYSHVMHLVSNVEGDAPDGLDPVDVVMAALPAGTLSGAPKVRAMEIIDELEIEKRGIGYAGAAGYFGSDGSVDTCIILRTALFKDGVMYVQAGGGVVADSDPDAEYDETLHKARALRSAAEESWRFI